jgi:hypothetical protein
MFRKSTFLTIAIDSRNDRDADALPDHEKGPTVAEARVRGSERKQATTMNRNFFGRVTAIVFFLGLVVSASVVVPAQANSLSGQAVKGRPNDQRADSELDLIKIQSDLARRQAAIQLTTEMLNGQNGSCPKCILQNTGH